METLKQIKEWFAEELYSWESYKDYPDDHMKHKNNINDYILELEKCDPDWEEENLIWEAWYVRWYEVALQEVITLIEKSNNKLVTKDTLEYLLKN